MPACPAGPSPPVPGAPELELSPPAPAPLLDCSWPPLPSPVPAALDPAAPVRLPASELLPHALRTRQPAHSQRLMEPILRDRGVGPDSFMATRSLGAKRRFALRYRHSASLECNNSRTRQVAACARMYEVTAQRARSLARRPAVRGFPAGAPDCARRPMNERLPSLSAYNARNSSNDETSELRAMPACARQSSTRLSPKETSSSPRVGPRSPPGRNDSHTSQRSMGRASPNCGPRAKFVWCDLTQTAHRPR